MRWGTGGTASSNPIKLININQNQLLLQYPIIFHQKSPNTMAIVSFKQIITHNKEIKSYIELITNTKIKFIYEGFTIC